MRAMKRMGSACAATAVALVVAVNAAAERQPSVDTPPPLDAICPAIEEDYDLCSADPWSGNCDDFISAAAALGRLYLFNVEREPEKADHFKSTIWWGCGSEHFSELKALLVRIDSAKARAVLQSQPYQAVAVPRPTEPAASTATSAAPEAGCDTLESWSQQSACETREWEAARVAHQKLFDACKTALAEPLRSQLVSQEKGWKASLVAECEPSDARCLARANRQRDTGIKRDFPQCGEAPEPPSVASSATGSAKTGMLPARWTPRDGKTVAVPFSYEARSEEAGTLFTTLGKGGRRFQGKYVRVEKSTKGHLITAIYDGWAGPEWEAWQHDADGRWTATGVSLGDFTHFYTDRVVAVLSSSDGGSMRCQITLQQPRVGFLGGGSGSCQITDGGRLTLEF